MITFEWVFVSWIITLFIHYHGVKRTSITTQKDSLIEQLSTICDPSWLDEHAVKLYLEEIYNSKILRVSWKVKQLNQLSTYPLVDEKRLDAFYSFDIETYVSKDTSLDNKSKLKFELQDLCNNLIDDIENTFFNKVTTSKKFMLLSIRNPLVAIFLSTGIIYLYLEIFTFFYR